MTDNGLHPRLQQTLLCDDVRREDNGKQILIGIYGNDVLLPGFPANITLCLWMRFTAPTEKQYSLEFSVVGEREQSLLPSLSVTMDVADASKYIDLAIRGVTLNVTEPQIVTFKWRSIGAELREILSIEVNTRATPPGSQS